MDSSEFQHIQRNGVLSWPHASGRVFPFIAGGSDAGKRTLQPAS